jgi:hypothetical protein
MAKNAKQQQQQQQPATLTHEQVIANAVKVTVAGFVSYATGTDAVKVSETKRATDAFKLIVGLRAVCTDAAEFATASVAAFGNTDRTKAGKVAGELAGELSKAGTNAETQKDLLKMIRAVCADWSDAIKAAGESSGLRAAYNAVLAARKKAAGTDGAGDADAPAADAPAAVKPPALRTMQEMIAQYVAEKRVGELLGMLESALLATKDTIRANDVHGVAVKFMQVN